MIYETIREDIEQLLEHGKSYTIITFDNTTEDIWGKTDTTGTQSTETLFMVRKYLGDKFAREGVKTVEYVVLIGSYDSSLNVGDKIRMDNHDYIVEGVQVPEDSGYTLFKRFRLIREGFD